MRNHRKTSDHGQAADAKLRTAGGSAGAKVGAVGDAGVCVPRAASSGRCEVRAFLSFRSWRCHGLLLRSAFVPEPRRRIHAPYSEQWELFTKTCWIFERINKNIFTKKHFHKKTFSELIAACYQTAINVDGTIKLFHMERFNKNPRNSLERIASGQRISPSANQSTR